MICPLSLFNEGRGGRDINQQLKQTIWDGLEIRIEVSEKLLAVALDVVDSIGSAINRKIEIEDILLLGSLASYHYTRSSDIDLHIVVDMEKLSDDEQLNSEFLGARAGLWNLQHQIEIDGHNVEIYFQDIEERNLSAGIYSLLQDRWIEFPTRVEFDEDIEREAKEATSRLIDRVRRLELLATMGYQQEALEGIKKFREWIRLYRKRGLSSQEGIASLENIVFKSLRSLGALNSLKDLETNIYDNLHSL